MRIKEDAPRSIERLSEDLTWEELMYGAYVRQSIEAGIADSEARRVADIVDVRSKFGLDSCRGR